MTNDAHPLARLPVPVVHAVTDDDVVADPLFVTTAEAVMRALGPRGALHLRAPSLSARAMLALAERLAATQESSGCWLVVNERIDVALAAGARGAQVTRHSILADDACRIAPALQLGVSVHTPAGAIAAATAGAHWVVAGHIHATPSHPGEPPHGDGLVIAAAAAGVPVIAIGGVRPSHVRALLGAGAHGVAAIRGIWGQGLPTSPEHAERAAGEYLSAHDESDRREHRPPDGER